MNHIPWNYSVCWKDVLMILNFPDDNLVELQKSFLGRCLVFTNGCFDILHVGHLRYLTEAASLGDGLVVGLNSDASVKRLKGAERPINNQQERAEMLLGLKAVTAVVIFSEDTPYNLIAALAPQVLVKGGDWPSDKIVGSDLVLQRGGLVKSLQLVENRSTSQIIEQIRLL